MFLLRRTAARAIASTPSKAIFVKPRSIATYTPAFRLRQQQWTATSIQRRFTSDATTKVDGAEEAAPEESAEAAAAAAENFAQTAPEAPIEDGLTPAQQDAQADPTDASATVGVDALETAAEGQLSHATKSTGGQGNPSALVYVGNLYYEVTEDQVNRVFSRFGTIKSTKIVKDNRGLSRGFAYVEYDSTADAQAAVDNLDMQVFEGRNLVVQFHKAKFEAFSKVGIRDSRVNPPSKTLFIGNMSFEMSDKDLNDMFRDIRNVMDVRVAIDRRTGQPRGFAHADFIDVASATRAKDVLKEKVIHGRQLRIDYSKSMPRRADGRPDGEADTA